MISVFAPLCLLIIFSVCSAIAEFQLALWLQTEFRKRTEAKRFDALAIVTRISVTVTQRRQTVIRPKAFLPQETAGERKRTLLRFAFPCLLLSPVASSGLGVGRCSGGEPPVMGLFSLQNNNHNR